MSYVTVIVTNMLYQMNLIFYSFFLGETWSDEASDLFEELSHAAKWKILMAKTVTYRQTEDGSVPCIELIDTNGKTVL